jgi:nucleotide-binding universal stress UspA family protein
MQQLYRAPTLSETGVRCQTSLANPGRHTVVARALRSAPRTGRTLRDTNPVFIVGVDDSRDARAAVHVAAGLARLLGGWLVLIHVLTPRQPATASSAHRCLRTYREDVRRAEALLRDAADLAGDVVVGSELRFGDPARGICQRAQDLRADLVIVGSRRLGKLGRLLLGSVSQGVLERSPCSVLVALAPPPVTDLGTDHGPGQ